MNKQRRKEISAIIARLKMISNKNNYDSETVSSILSNINDDLNTILSDEEYYMDNIPENMQGGYKHEKAEEACNNIESAIDEVIDAIDNTDDKNDMINCIESAISYLFAAT